MTVDDILKIKGKTVCMVTPSETALGLAEKLRAEQIGAVVVSEDGVSIDGIISERDLAFGLAEYVNKLSSMTVDQIMTRNVVVCSPSDTISKVMLIMTGRRVRHLPVKTEGRVVGIISIRDVLEHRLNETMLEAAVLRDYVIALGGKGGPGCFSERRNFNYAL